MHKHIAFVACAGLVIGALLTGMAYSATAAVPQLINCQGILLDSSGDPVTTAVNVTFTIWDDPFAGNSLWTETQTVTPDDQARFNVLLGTTTVIPKAAFAGDAYLEIDVAGTGPLIPRQRIVSVGYAYRALDADTAALSLSAAPSSVNSAAIVDGAIQFLDIGQNAAAAGQVMKWNGSAWVAANDEVGAAWNWSDSSSHGPDSVLFADSASHADASGFADSTDAITDGGVDFADIGQNGAAAGQVMKWNGSAWISAKDDVGAAWNWSDSSSHGPDSVLFADSASHADASGFADSTDAITDGGVDFADIGQNGAASGQVMKWNGSTWVAADDKVGTGSGWTDDGTVVRLNTGTDSVGIGTATPAAKLDVVGDMVISGKATIGPGHTNTGTNAFVAGSGNTASGGAATVGGGENNTASGYSATVGGGYGDTASGLYATVGGGMYNTASGYYSTASGGESNSASNDYATASGGYNNTANGSLATVGGGSSNTASNTYATASGGYGNTASGYSAAVGGGRSNTASDSGATVGGGQYNTASGSYATVGGGSGSTASSNYATVGGGYGNNVYGLEATVGGGENNTASNTYATVGGGSGNTASGHGATVGGGQFNIASGTYSTVPGGYYNAARGYKSFAAGFSAKANHYGSMVIAANFGTINDSVQSGGDEQMVLRADGGLYITNTAQKAPYNASRIITTRGGAYLSGNGTTWTNASDKNQKENFTDIDRVALLEKIASLPITRWNYKVDDPAVQHIGPVAQDFYRLFGVGSDDKSISTIDPSGIALAAIQELHRRNQELAAKVTELQTLVQKLAEKRQ